MEAETKPSMERVPPEPPRAVATAEDDFEDLVRRIEKLNQKQLLELWHRLVRRI